MEDFSIRAIIIGVSLFVTMLVLSAVIIYFNTARGIADKVSNRADIAALYDDIMNTDNFELDLTGVEVRSLINKYAGDEDVEINIIKISGIATPQYVNVNNTYTGEDGWLTRINDNAHLISEEKLDIINPVWNCEVKKSTEVVDAVENVVKTILDISLDV